MMAPSIGTKATSRAVRDGIGVSLRRRELAAVPILQIALALRGMVSRWLGNTILRVAWLVACLYLGGLLPGLAQQESATSLKVVLDRERHVLGWIRPEMPSRVPAAGAEYTAKEFILPVPAGLRAGWAILFEPETGNAAISKYSTEITEWKLKQEDWRIGEVKLVARFGETPLAEGEAQLQQKDLTFVAEVENGEAVFFGVSPGTYAARVMYDGVDKKVETTPIEVELSLERSEKVPTIAVGLVEAPKTKKAAPSSGAPSGAGATKSSPWANWVVWLIAAVVGGAALFGMYSLLKANEERVALAMRRLGAPLPDRGAAGTDSNQPQDGPTGTGEAFSTQPPIEPIVQGVEPVTAPAATPEAWILEGEGISFRLDREGEYIVGRDPECDLLLSDATVSRKHAAIRFQQNDLRVEDLGSTNGTMVNGRRIEGGASLQDGDVIHFGRLTIRVYRKGASR